MQAGIGSVARLEMSHRISVCERVANAIYGAVVVVDISGNNKIPCRHAAIECAGIGVGCGKVTGFRLNEGNLC